MDTTYSTPVSISFRVATCEGHTASEIQHKSSEMKAFGGEMLRLEGSRSTWMLLTSGCQASRTLTGDIIQY